MSPRRSIVAGFAVLALVAGGTTPVSAVPPRAALTDFVCQRALDPPARGASVTAVMRPLPGTLRLALKFDLLRERKHRGTFKVIRAGDLGAWISPTDVTLGQRSGDKWKLDKQVGGLPAPAVYRLRVVFRWIGGGGQVLGQIVRTTPDCDQPERRPDLLVRTLDVKSITGKPHQNAYVAVIANRGATGAGPFEIELSGSGIAPAQVRTIARLGPHSARAERFLGPACTTGQITLTVDSSHKVDDYDRNNNSRSVICSSPGKTPGGPTLHLVKQ